MGTSGISTAGVAMGEDFLRGEKAVLLSYPPGIRGNHTSRFSLYSSTSGKITLTIIFRVI
jgi:hypothetical protein